MELYIKYFYPGKNKDAQKLPGEDSHSTVVMLRARSSLL